MEETDWRDYDYNQNDPTEESDDEEESASAEVQYYEAKKVLKKTPESPVWKFFVFPGTKDSINEKKVACKLCLESSDVKMRRKVYSYSGGTKNLIDHLERCHKDNADWKTAKEEDEKKKKSQSAPNKITAYTNATSTVPKWPKASSNWKKNTQLLSEWVVLDTRPSESVEDPGLVRVFKSLCPQFEPPCSQTVTNYIEKSYETKKEEIIIELKTIDSVAITTDGGSSSNARSYQDTNIHFISPEWELKSYVLAVRESKGEHTAENYRKNTFKVLEEFEIATEKIALFVTDNENKMRCAFKDEERSGCGAHILHKTVQKGCEIAVIQRLILKMRKVSTKHNKSPKMRYALEKFQEEKGLKIRPLIQDCPTRWGSTKVSSDHFLNHKEDKDKDRFANMDAVNSALRTLKRMKKEKLQDLIITKAEMVQIENLNDFLTRLDVLSTHLGGNKFVTSSVVIPTLYSIKNHLSPSVNDVSYISEMKTVMLEDIADRIQKNLNFPFLFKSTALDPRFKKLKMIDNKEDRKNIQESLKVEMRKLAIDSEPRIEDDDEDLESEPKKARVVYDFEESDSEDDDGDGFGDDKVRKEFEQFMKEPQIDKASPPGSELSWWKIRESNYPLLSRLAKKFLCVPATSVEAERTFSALGNLMTKKRLCLTGTHVDMQLFLKDKYKK